MSQQAAPPPIHRANTVLVVNRKSVAVSYVLWFFLCMLGIHKFYLRQPVQGVIYLALAILGWSTTLFFIGWAFLAIVWIGLIVDIFTLPGRVRTLNSQALAGGIVTL